MLCYLTFPNVTLCYVTLYHVTLSLITLCYAVLCYFVLCYAICYIMLCYAFVMLRYVMQCYVTLCWVTFQYETWCCYIMLCYVTLRYALLLCYVALRHVSLRYVTLPFVAICYVIFVCRLAHCFWFTIHKMQFAKYDNFISVLRTGNCPILSFKQFVLRCIELRHIMLRQGMSCHVIFHIFPQTYTPTWRTAN